MKKSLQVLSLALVLSTAAVSSMNAMPTSPPHLHVADERQVRNYNGVAVSGSINAVVTLGSQESVRLEGDADAIAELITELKGGILIIRPKTKWNEWGRKFKSAKITAYITAKKLSSVTVSGSGRLEVKGNVDTNDLSATVSGSGNISVAANTKSFTGVISGSGNIHASGKSNATTVTIGGSGNFDGKGLTTETLSTQISGSGSVYITANKSIEAVISGSGTVNYSGNASVEKTVSGSGSVRKS